MILGRIRAEVQDPAGAARALRAGVAARSRRASRRAASGRLDPEAPGRLVAEVRSARGRRGRSWRRSWGPVRTPKPHGCSVAASSRRGIGTGRPPCCSSTRPTAPSILSSPSRLPTWGRLAAPPAIALNSTPCSPAGTPRPSPAPASWEASPSPTTHCRTRAIPGSRTGSAARVIRWSSRPGRTTASRARSSIMRSAPAITSPPSSAGTIGTDRSWSGCPTYRVPAGHGLGYRHRPAAPAGRRGRVPGQEDVRRRWRPAMRLTCHTTNVYSILHEAGPEAADRSIGCERCHGPGGHHVAAVAAGFSGPGDRQPRQASPAAIDQLCEKCHGCPATRGPRPAADRPRLAPLPVLDLALESVLHRERWDAGLRDLSRPAPQRRDLASPGTRRSASSCHAPDVASTSAGSSPPPASGRRADPSRDRPAAKGAKTRCPVNPTRGCIDCHMPRIWVQSTHSFKTDHFIRVRDQAPSESRVQAVH